MSKHDGTPAPNTARTGSETSTRESIPVAQVGRYILFKRLGEGGMGVVYAAYDPDLDRKVALKLLRPGTQADPEEARARLLREAQAMARVSHPNVIPVFDVGIFGDQVFVAMELIDGGTLGSWLKEARRPWRDVVDRFLAAGRGLLAAHDAGLVHRDFKPANVLVNRAGRVFVTDFGLARKVGPSAPGEPLPEEALQMLPSEQRMLEHTLTEAGLVIGTPSYMSPEQFRGADLDARTDQFSFCVALYWALYGARPFDPGSMRAYASASASASGAGAGAGTERTATVGATKSLSDAAGPPALAATVIRDPPRDVKVPAWVRRVVMQGLALEPSARFGSMKELLDALSQEQRQTRRAKWVVATGAVAVGVAVAAGVAWQRSRVCVDAGAPMDSVWNAEAARKLEASFASTGRPFAAEMAARTTKVLAGYAESWKRQSTQACEETRLRGVRPEELFARQTVCLDRRRKDLRATVDLLQGADAALVEKALDAALALPSVGECEDAESLAERQRLPEDPTRRAEISRLEEQLTAVRAGVDAGRYQAALEEARKLEAPVLATGYWPLMAEWRFHLGWAQEQLGESPDASKLLSRAAFDAEAGRADRLKVAILNKLLYVEDGQRHFDQAASWGSLAEATLQRIGGDAVLEGDVRVNRANLAVSQDQFPEAQALLEQAGALYARANLPPDHPKRTRSLFLLGRVLLSRGNAEPALAVLEEALKQTEVALGPIHPDMVRRHGMLSWTLRDLGRYDQALAHARALADIDKALYGEQSPQYAEGLDEVGMCELGLKRYEDALRTYQQALSLKQKALPADDEKLQPSFDGVGQALLGLGRARESVDSLRRAVSFATAPAEDLAETGFVLAKALWQAGSPPEARDAATEARQRFTEEGLDERVGEVDSWLSSLPSESPRDRRVPGAPGRASVPSRVGAGRR